MKRAVLSVLCAVLVVGLASCGGGYGGGSGNTDTSSKLPNKVFVSNSFQGILQVIDANQDLNTRFSVSLGGTPTQMFLSQDKSTVMVFDSRNHTIACVDTAKETLISSISVGDVTESFVSTKDGKTGYVAVRNGVNAAGPGVIDVLDMRTQGVLTSAIPIPSVRWLAANNAVNRLLAFNDISDDVYSVDLTATTLAATKLPLAVGSVSRPVAAFFSADDSKAYILSCGPECGGTQAMVTELTIATNATRTVNVDAARAATLQGTTLYVTGSPNGSGGIVQKVDTAAMTASPSVPIGPGIHSIVQFAGNKLFVGSQACQGSGCLSMWDPSSSTATTVNPDGDVTAITPVPHRDVLYVIEGGELHIYNISTGERVPPVIDIVGAAYGAVAVSQ